MTRRIKTAAAMAALALLASSCFYVERVSVGPSGETTVDVAVGDVSGDGRFVVFVTDAALFAADTNGVDDIFVRDTLSNTTDQLTFGWDGSPTDGPSYEPVISEDGAYVAYTSDATNIFRWSGTVGGFPVVHVDDNGAPDVFRVAVGSTGSSTVSRYRTSLFGSFIGNGTSRNPAIDATGRHVAFESTATAFDSADTNGLQDIYRRDFNAFFANPERISLDAGGNNPNGASFTPAISDNGLVVAYASDATDIVAGDTNGRRDIFLRGAGLNQLASMDSGGGPTNGHSYEPLLDAIGVNVAFESLATDIVAGDTNAKRDVFTRNLFTATNERASVDNTGAQFGLHSHLYGFDDGAGRVLWAHQAGAFFLRDLDAQTTDLISGASLDSVLSDDGRYIGLATNDPLTEGDTDGAFDVYVRAYPAPQPSSVSPPTVQRGQTTAITVSGRGFTDVHKIWTEFIVSPDNKISYSNLTVVDDSTITADVTVTNDADLGPFWVNLETPDGGPGPGSGAFGNCQCLTVVS